MAVVSGISTPSLTTTLATASNDKMTYFLNFARVQKISLDIRLVPIEKVFPDSQCHHSSPHSQ